ncbi:MAG: hypothetical protein ABIQ31_02695 [Ferruginibacter sp.]
MNNFQKYSRLMTLVAAAFFGFIIFVALLIFVLRLFSITMFNIPGFDLFFQYVIIIIPYILFFGAYYYLYKKKKLSKTRPPRIIGGFLIILGCVICLFTLGLSTALFLHVKSHLLNVFEENSQFALIIQVVIILITAGVIASGDVKEKDWMERNA